MLAVQSVPHAASTEAYWVRYSMISASNVVIQGGTFNNQNRTSRGIDILLEWVAAGAFHNSDELYDAPKCHPHTRVAVLDDIMKWVGESESAREDFIMWLFGPAGAGKSAIAKRIAEIAADMGMLIATFFFSRASPTRSNKNRLTATLAYQLALSIPNTRPYIVSAVEKDPTIFRKNVQTQIDTLLVKPLQSIPSTQITPSKKLIIIDGLDECNDSQAQVAILDAISRSFTQHKLPIIFLIVSRPEPDIVISFNSHEQLRSIHRRLALDDSYRPDDDIRLFFSDKFKHIKQTHLLRSTIPASWPTRKTLETLVEKSSGQFIYASTVVKFVESRCHRPSARLNIILGISPPGTMNPFAELDGVYNHLLSCVDDIQLTLRVLSFFVMTPDFASRLGKYMSPELFLSLEPGDIQLALMNLSSIVTYHESSGAVEVLHASLVDFLSDKRRSTTFYIDKASRCTDFFRRILQYIEGPNGIRAGDIDLFHGVNDLYPWIPKGQLWSDISNFDLDAFINASTRRRYFSLISTPTTIETLQTWMDFLDVALDDGDKKEALDLLNKSLESRLQIYQSHWQLQLLVTLAVTEDMHFAYLKLHGVPSCRCWDILLEMDDHNLHLVDQNALDLRHAYMLYRPRLIGMMISPYLDGDTYASAALHCMYFLSKTPKYFDELPEMGIPIYEEWRQTCYMTLEMLCKFLQQANTLPELVKFISDHYIHPHVRNNFSVEYIWKVDLQIRTFLEQAGVHPNRLRMVSAMQHSLMMTHQPSSDSDSRDSDGDEGWRVTRQLIRQRLDQCCSNIHRI